MNNYYCKTKIANVHVDNKMKKTFHNLGNVIECLILSSSNTVTQPEVYTFSLFSWRLFSCLGLQVKQDIS